MGERFLILVFLLCYSIHNINGFREENAVNKDKDYLDYIASKRREIEDVLLSQRLERNVYPKRHVEYFDSDYDDDDDRRSEFPNAEDDEERDEEEERLRDIQEKRIKRMERIEKLKKESNNFHSPNHVIEDAKIKKSKDNRPGKKVKLLKKSPKTKAKMIKQKHAKKDLIVVHESEADPIRGPARGHDEQTHNLREEAKSSTDEVAQKNSAKSEKEPNKKSDVEFQAKEPGTLGQKEIFKNPVKKTSSSNKSAPSHAPRIVPNPQQVSSKKTRKKLDQALFIVVVAACSIAGIAGLVLASYCWYRLRKETTDVTEAEYEKNSSEKKKEKQAEMTDDEKLAKSAEVYHYMHAKKQLAAMENTGMQKKANVNDSDSSDEESDNTVYECPGLAPPGDMKVVNPLFSDAERDHSDARSDGSHVSSPIRDFSPPQPSGQGGASKH